MGQQIVDQYVELPLHITGSTSGEIIIKAKAYVVTGITAGVILGMDELDKKENNIALWLGKKIMQIEGIDVPISFTSPGRMLISFHAFMTGRFEPESHTKSTESQSV